jgi:uncharacterized cupin superfamily protein
MSQARRHPHVVRFDEVEPQNMTQGDFSQQSRRLGQAAGGRALGCTSYELPPGKTAFPFHFHSAIEEAIYILEGEGTLRIGKEKVAIGQGDYIAMPPGPDSAHALSNRGQGPLRYLCMSGPATPMTLDIIAYPDSKKIALAAGIEPGKVAWRDGAWIVKLIKEEQPEVGYFDDEPLARK